MDINKLVYNQKESRLEYNSYRHILGFERCPEFLKWMKEQFPNMDLHHLLGSYTGKKMTDFLVIPLEHKFHLEKVTPDPGAYFAAFLPDAVRYLSRWALYINGGEERPILEILEKDKLSPEAIKKLIKYAQLRNN